MASYILLTKSQLSKIEYICNFTNWVSIIYLKGKSLNILTTTVQLIIHDVESLMFQDISAF